MNDQPIRRSRLNRQENKKMARQTWIIILSTIVFLIAFVAIGIPGLMKLAVALGDAKSSSKFAAQEDKIPPLPPQLNPLPEATSSNSITLDGFAESGSIVTVYLNGNKLNETTTDNQGNFSFTNLTLDMGINNFDAVAADNAGNMSQHSPVQAITYDDESPELTINSPNDGDEVYGELKQLIDISGTTDPDAQLTVNDLHIVVTGDGNFSTKYSLQEGNNTLTFTAKDKAGNETIKELSVNFSK